MDKTFNFTFDVEMDRILSIKYSIVVSNDDPLAGPSFFNSGCKGNEEPDKQLQVFHHLPFLSCDPDGLFSPATKYFRKEE